MIKPFFSILIPCYNAKNTVKIAIESCINQEFKNFEIIIADNCSNDGTAEIIKEIKIDNLISFTGKRRINNIDLRNFLINKAQGKYLIWLEPYDRLTPFFLMKAYNILCYQKYDILEFSMMWLHKDGNFDITTVNDIEYVNNNCLELYLNRTDALQDFFVGKVFNAELMKKLQIPSFDIYQYEECFYSLPLYYYANSYKSFSNIYVYDYHVDENRNNELDELSLENIKTMCKIRNEQLNRNIKLLKENNLHQIYSINLLNKLYLYNIFQSMLRLEDLNERKEAFQEFYKYFTIQLSANIFMENNNESN